MRGLAGLIVATVIALAFVPMTESIRTCEPHIFPTTIFQHAGTPGPSNHIMKAILYTTGLVALLVAALRLPLRYGITITSLLFSFGTLLSMGSMRGLIGGWVLLPAWLILLLGTAASGGLLWLKLVELLHSKPEGQQGVAPLQRSNVRHT